MIPFWKNAAGRARWTRLLLAAALVWVPLAAQGAILTRLKNGENLKLAAIGTSLTANTDGWFPQTGAWLNGLSYTGKVTLSNRSVAATASQPVPGHPTGGTVQLSTVLANDNPDAVFIEFAINDAYTPYNISQQTSKNNLQSMITQINTWAGQHSKQVDIIVQTMSNCIGGTNNDGGRPLLSQYYQGYRDVVQANPGVLLVDNYPNWLSLYNSQPAHTTWNSYVPDGIHPTATGAQTVILPTIKTALISQTPEPASIVLLATGLICFLTYAWRRRK